MRYRVSLTDVAKADLRAIAVWMDEVAGAGRGVELQDALLRSIQSLAGMPLRWQVDPVVSTKKHSIRRLLYLEPHHEYLIYFTVTGDEVHVLHVRHASRRSPRRGSLR